MNSRDDAAPPTGESDVPAEAEWERRRRLGRRVEHQQCRRLVIGEVSGCHRLFANNGPFGENETDGSGLWMFWQFFTRTEDGGRCQQPGQ